MAAETAIPATDLDNLIPLNETANGENGAAQKGRANQRCRARSFLRVLMNRLSGTARLYG